jgi:hypothetical protein
MRRCKHQILIGLLCTAWFNAGSTLIVLSALMAATGFYFYLRSKRRHRLARIVLSSSTPRDEEERVPLGPESFELSTHENGYERNGAGPGYKGKVREEEEYQPQDVVFELGEEDDDERGKFR